MPPYIPKDFKGFMPPYNRYASNLKYPPEQLEAMKKYFTDNPDVQFYRPKKRNWHWLLIPLNIIVWAALTWYFISLLNK